MWIFIRFLCKKTESSKFNLTNILFYMTLHILFVKNDLNPFLKSFHVFFECPLCLNGSALGSISRDWDGRQHLHFDLQSRACWVLTSQIQTRGRSFQLFLRFSIPTLHLIHFLTHPSPHLTPCKHPPLFSVAQQPSVINELLQLDLICLRIGHVW